MMWDNNAKVHSNLCRNLQASVLAVALLATVTMELWQKTRMNQPQLWAVHFDDLTSSSFCFFVAAIVAEASVLFCPTMTPWNSARLPDHIPINYHIGLGYRRITHPNVTAGSIIPPTFCRGCLAHSAEREATRAMSLSTTHSQKPPFQAHFGHLTLPKLKMYQNVLVIKMNRNHAVKHSSNKM